MKNRTLYEMIRDTHLKYCLDHNLSENPITYASNKIDLYSNEQFLMEISTYLEYLLEDRETK